MKILIVDDNAINRVLLGSILEAENHSYVTAVNGQKACEIFDADSSIDLVLMDINMPVMDGYDATRHIKKSCGSRYLPIIFVTALDSDAVLAKCLEVGGDDFISKPINESVVNAKINAHQRTTEFHNQLVQKNKELLFHRRIMDREHAIVEHVFQNGMKRMDIDSDNIKFHVSPMSMFNGDLLLIAPSPSGGFYLLLGDFTGHGLSAAIGCLPVADIFYSMAEKHASIGSIATEINLRLQTLLPTNMFFCASVLEMNKVGDRISLWSGGMNDILFIDEKGQIEQRVSSKHMPLGILSADEFDAEVSILKLKKNSKGYIYTDGVIESENPNGDSFGEERLEKLLKLPSRNTIDSVFRALTDFRQGAEQSDDISMVEIGCFPVVHHKPLQVLPEDDSDSCMLPWRLSLKLTPHFIRTADVVDQLLKLVVNIENVSVHRDIIFTLLTELYTNALEHGLMGLDSSRKDDDKGFFEYYQKRKRYLASLDDGEILFGLSVSAGKDGRPARLKFRFSDSGSGFDHEAVMATLKAGDDLPYGRGIALVMALCESIEYSEGGRTVEAVYSLE